jgi:hypothetical protein
VLFIGSCFISNNFFEVFASIGKFLGIVYLLMQNLSFNEFFFRWSNDWIEKASKNTCYTILYIFFTIVSIVGTVFLVVFNFRSHWKEGCGLNKFWLILNIVFIVLFFVLTAINSTNPKDFREDVNYVCCSLYSLYTTYYFYSGMASDTDLTCSELVIKKGFVYSEILINILLILVVFLFLSFAKSVPFIPPEELKSETEHNLEFKNEVKYKKQFDNAGNMEAGAKLEYRTRKYVWIFSCYFFLTVYFQNIIVNWGTVSLFEGLYLFSNNKAGYFIKVGNGVICGLFYVLILTVPLFSRGKTYRTRNTQIAPAPAARTKKSELPPI